MDPATWGIPSAAYPSSTCNITELFPPQQLVLVTTLCGSWAGIPDIYASTCPPVAPVNSCYADNIIGPGSPKYDNAYFEIAYLRTYTAQTNAPLPSTSQGLPANSTSTTATSSSSQAGPLVSPSPSTSSGEMTRVSTHLWRVIPYLLLSWFLLH